MKRHEKKNKIKKQEDLSENQTFMKEKPVLPLVLSMSLPMVLSMLTNSLYNIIDSYFVAKISEDAMTALSLIFPLQLLVTSVGVGFGIGINAVAAFFLGAQDTEKANDAASAGVLFSLLHGAVLTAVCLIGAPYFLRLFTQDAVILRCGLDYSHIVFAFSTVITAAIAYEKVFQAEGKMTISMVSMLCGSITKIVLDPVMIFGLGPVHSMGIKGAAWATVIGQAVSLVIYLVIYFVKPLPLRIRFRRELFDPGLCKQLYIVGVPATLNMALPSLLITCLNGILAVFSPMYVFILGVYYKLQTFIYLTANGIVQGIRPIVGYNYGAKEYPRIRQVFRTALILAAAVMAAGMVICLIAAGPLIRLFTENPETIKAGQTALRIISLGFVISTVSVIVSGTLEGLGKGIHSMMISLMRNVFVILPAAWLLSRILGPVGVWHGFWITEVITAMAAAVLYRRYVVGKLLAS